MVLENDVTKDQVDALVSALHTVNLYRQTMLGGAAPDIQEHVTLAQLNSIAAAVRLPIKGGDRQPSGACYSRHVDYNGVHFWASDFTGGF